MKNTHKTRTVVLVIYRALLRVLLSHQPNSGSFQTVEEHVKSQDNPFLSVVWDVIFCLGSFVLFHDAVRKANVEEVSLARKALYPLLFAFHNTNYAQLVAHDEGSVQ